ncbi:MAG: hypothetical protein Fur0037_25870 [Planctomycetota bacterium]
MHPPSRMLLAAALLCACSQGGKETRPQSDVRIAAIHHLFGFRALRGFGTFPVSPDVSFPDRSTLSLTDRSTYTITRSGATSGEDDYALAQNGALSILVHGGSGEPTVAFPGGYGLVSAANADLFFVDRFSTPASPSVGLFFGARVVQGIPDLSGGWHLLSQHLIFSSSTLLSTGNVARGAHGGISIATGTPGDPLAISGTGTESTRVSLVFGGTAQALAQGSTGDGTMNLTISYQDSLQPPGTADSRVLVAAAGEDIVYAVDQDESDGEAGIVLLVRKFDAPTTVADPARAAGTYLLGAQTFFVDPMNSGADAAIGTLLLTAQGAFRIDMIGSQGIDFAYSGTFSLGQDGGMTLSVDGTNETWFGAIRRDYNTVAVIDDFVETRNNPELNLFFGVREKQTAQ